MATFQIITAQSIGQRRYSSMTAASATPLLDAMGLKPGAGLLEKLRQAVDKGTLDFHSLCIPLILEIR